MLEADESKMVSGARARALGSLATYVQLDAKTKTDLANAVVARLRGEPVDITRHHLFYGAFCKLVGAREGDTPWDLSVDAIDWSFIDGALASL